MIRFSFYDRVAFVAIFLTVFSVMTPLVAICGIYLLSFFRGAVN